MKCSPRTELYYTVLVTCFLVFLFTGVVRHDARTNDVTSDGNRLTLSSRDRYLLEEVWGKRLCVAILTGYPNVNRRAYVTRLLRQLENNVTSPKSYDLHVFCDGRCKESLKPEHPGIYHELTDADPGVDGNSKVRDGEELFSADRWRYLSRNYVTMFRELYMRSGYEYCVILEDDLILSPDALLVLRAGIKVMEDDPSVFTASLHNDNSFPPYARNCSSFRRVSHFSGLGFVMSRRNYRKYLTDDIGRSQDWDATIQEIMRVHNLVSIQPEMTRSIHLRNKYVTSAHDVKVPRTIFESLRTCQMYAQSYDLSYLQQERYDKYVSDLLKDAPVVSNLEETLFLDDPGKVVVFAGCRKQKNLDRMLTLRHLWGGSWSNGAVTRGSYRGTLFLRYYTATVLIACRDSPLYPRARHLSPPRHPSPYAGILYRLERDHLILLGRENQSCRDVCAERGARCDVTALWLLNEQCTVMQMYVNVCTTCRTHVYRKTNYHNYLPAVDDRGRCRQGYPHHLSCDTATPRERRICACS